MMKISILGAVPACWLSLSSLALAEDIEPEGGFVKWHAEFVYPGSPCAAIRVIETRLALIEIAPPREATGNDRFFSGTLTEMDQEFILGESCFTPPQASMAAWTVGGRQSDADAVFEVRAILSECIQGACGSISLDTRTYRFGIHSNGADALVPLTLSGLGTLTRFDRLSDLDVAVDTYRTGVSDLRMELDSDARSARRTVLREHVLLNDEGMPGGFFAYYMLAPGGGGAAGEIVWLKGAPDGFETVLYRIR